MTMKQCKLKNGNVIQVAWIESRGARVGASVELKEDKQFWEVLEVGASMESDRLQERSQDYKRTRVASDV